MFTQESRSSIQDINEGMLNLKEAIISNYYNQYNGSKNAKFDVEFEIGRKYIRIVTVSWGSRSAYGFIVNTHTDKQFSYGDVLKPAGWKAPTRNFRRFNVLDFNSKNINWSGL